jgi:hypothetical protein
MRRMITSGIWSTGFAKADGVKGLKIRTPLQENDKVFFFFFWFFRSLCLLNAKSAGGSDAGTVGRRHIGMPSWFVCLLFFFTRKKTPKKEPPHSHPGDDQTIVVEGKMTVQKVSDCHFSF